MHREKINEKEKINLVCRQICREVRDVAYQFSEIQFDWKNLDYVERATALEVCADYLSKLAEGVRKGLGRIVIIEQACNSDTDLQRMGLTLTGRRDPAIYAFCRDFPKAQVIIRLGRRLGHWVDEIDTHIALRMVLRDEGVAAFPEKDWAMEDGCIMKRRSSRTTSGAERARANC